MTTSTTVWILAYEMGGSSDAAWTLRYGDPDGDSTIYEANDRIPEDDESAAQRWATDYIASCGDQVMGGGGWKAHQPGPGAQPDYWTAIIS